MNTSVREGETIEGSRTMRNRPYPVLKCSSWAPQVDAMAHLPRADAVVLSASHFGWAPAVLNPNCVVQAPRLPCMRGQKRRGDWTSGALEGWVRGLPPQQMGEDSPPMRKFRADLFGYARSAGPSAPPSGQ